MFKSSSVMARIFNFRYWGAMLSPKRLIVHKGHVNVKLVIPFAANSEHSCSAVVIIDHFNVAYK